MNSIILESFQLMGVFQPTMVLFSIGYDTLMTNLRWLK